LAILLAHLLPIAEYEALMPDLEDIEDISAAEEALRKIESGEDFVIGRDEFLRHDVAR
jgi:predicted DNA-binding protein